MNITAIIYDADARRTAYILGTVIGNCKLFPAERAPRDWSGYANVITVAAGEDGSVVTAGVQKRVTFRPKGEDETVAAAASTLFWRRTTRSRSRPAAASGCGVRRWNTCA